MPVIKWEAAKFLTRLEKTEEGEPDDGSGTGRTKVKRGKGSRKADGDTELSVVKLSAESGKPVMFFVHGNCNGAAGVACKTMGKLILRQTAVLTRPGTSMRSRWTLPRSIRSSPGATS